MLTIKELECNRDCLYLLINDMRYFSKEVIIKCHKITPQLYDCLLGKSESTIEILAGGIKRDLHLDVETIRQQWGPLFNSCSKEIVYYLTEPHTDKIDETQQGEAHTITVKKLKCNRDRLYTLLDAKKSYPKKKIMDNYDITSELYDALLVKEGEKDYTSLTRQCIDVSYKTVKLQIESDGKTTHHKLGSSNTTIKPIIEYLIKLHVDVAYQKRRPGQRNKTD